MVIISPEYVDTIVDRTIEQFLDPLIRVRTIHDERFLIPDSELEKACRIITDKLRDTGFQHVERLPVEGGNPVIYAERTVGRNKPTLLFYAHYDVVAGADELFNPRIEDGKIRARGATDDKGPMSAFFAAMKFLDSYNFDGCNIKVVIEGNEEQNSKMFKQFLQKYSDRLRDTDVVLIMDTPTSVSGEPAIANSLKGIVKADVTTTTPEELVDILHNSHDPINNRTLLNGFYDEIIEVAIDPVMAKKQEIPPESLGKVRPEKDPNSGRQYTWLEHTWYRPTNIPLLVEYRNPSPQKYNGAVIRITASGPKAALHSGQYGGPVQDPALNLAHLLVGLRDAGLKYEIDFIQYGDGENRIQPKGEVQITFEDGINLVAISRAIDGVCSGYEIDRELFDVQNTIKSERTAYLQDKRFKTEPGKATARLSYRLVRGQEPEEITDSLEQYVRRNSSGASFKVIGIDPAFAESKTDDPFYQAIREGYQQGYGTTEQVPIIGIGGSIAAPSFLKEVLGDIPIVLGGISPPDSGYHGPNEFLPVSAIVAGAKSVIHSLHNLAAVGKR